MKTLLRFAALISLAAPGLALGKDQVVTQKAKQFSVAEITIAAGDKLVFKNDDDTSHNVFSSADGSKFNLGIQKPGSESSQAFAAAGTYEVRCAIHPKMKLKVTVTP